MEIINALQAKNGKRTELNKMGNITQPLQFLPKDEKDANWTAHNLDWLEWEGMKQLRRNARRIMKNYKLAAGIIDKSDYIVEQDNDYKDMVNQLAEPQQQVEALELKFYPIIPNVINVLVAEFAKRNKRISFRSTDEYSYNEIMDKKQAAIKGVLVQQAEQKLIMKMVEQGLDPNDPEMQQKMQQDLSPEGLRSLPEIQDFFSKSYQTLAEEWAAKQHIIDEERFKMDELEERAFRDSLVCDREFWHFKMLEEDYDIELWNPALTFYHKSPDVRYVSEGNWVGKLDMMSVADVIDKYGWVMNQEQMEALESIYPVRAAGYPVQGYQNETYYDGTKTHAWNVNGPSLAYRQFTSMVDNFASNGGDIVNWILGQSEDYMDLGSSNMLRVATIYWKSQCKIGYLTKIDDAGKIETDFIDESYKVTDKPLYNNSLLRGKDVSNLLFGEHIEWVWVNQVYGGVKIGPNHPSFWGTNNPGGINPIYLGINQNAIKPLKFQFKGDRNIYGCKLPVEGRIFSDRNTKSMAPVDLMKPFQIGYNMVNNQIADILVDEIGSVLIIDHNALPQHSLGEDWGKHNYSKAYQVMKDFQIMPLDTSISNTENGMNFSHFQTVNLEQTARIMSRVQLANYFKAQCFENIGVVPQRMGQQIGQTNTATGIEQAVAGSYAQTEMLFVQHSDHLMPRVHQMRTDLAQYYHSKKPSIRLQTMTTNDERVNFEINGTDLMLRDINIYASAKASHRDILDKLQRMALENNTSGASLYDLGKIAQTDSIGTLNNTLREIDEKMQAQRKEQMAHEQNMKQMEVEQRTKEKAMELDQAAREKEKDRRNEVLVAEIRSAGFGAMQDIDKNNQSDYLDFLDRERETTQYQDTMNLQREKEGNKNNQFAQKQDLEREKMGVQLELKERDVQIARENKNKFDVKPKQDSKKKK